MILMIIMIIVYYYYASTPTPTGAAVFLLAESLAVSGATFATPSQATYATLAAQVEPKLTCETTVQHATRKTTGQT